jgi:transposase-like protein
MKDSRNNFSASEKVAILRRHLLEGVAVSTLCDQHSIQPTVFYRWQKALFENAEAVFETPKGKRRAQHEEERIAALQAKLRRKDEVLGELMEEHVALKKSLGEI